MTEPTVSPLNLAIQPGRAAGPFALGMPMDMLINAIRTEPCIVKTDFKYSNTSPLGVDIVLDLVDNGICFRIDPVSQRLKCIELYEFSKLRLTYKSIDFSSNKHLATFILIYKTFGPTNPGEYLADYRYSLKYPGISFLFPIPEKYFPTKKTNDLPLSLPDGSTPIVNRIYIYQGESWARAVPPALASRDVLSEKLVIKAGTHVTFTRKACAIEFGCMSQDVLAQLGRPSVSFFKQDDKMNIHGAREQRFQRPSKYYIWSYFLLGIDIFFDTYTHTVKKFAFHTNFPGQYDFNRYRKCNFEIASESKAQNVTSDSTWTEILQAFGEPLGDPVIFDRGPTTPFGATSFYGYKGLIFEIMKNGYICSLTMYQCGNT
ncbi:uncharacterized protein BJ171DRAFT_615043 [Polychytrium aggregatum]|uniref:uncharacterized protein n=1 Tax=Polychytrium aggregatum TaxID=110093 RepID=UPI0022FE5022|nr:uncharacterized protein BJ171DRAFT_615043 [Polychytrium aggregatum]KAI9205588.1 hypothetical protein BJ171DRAFT_615043 [Polychytrium aggregatum]